MLYAIEACFTPLAAEGLPQCNVDHMQLKWKTGDAWPNDDNTSTAKSIMLQRCYCQIKDEAESNLMELMLIKYLLMVSPCALAHFSPHHVSTGQLTMSAGSTLLSTQIPMEWKKPI